MGTGPLERDLQAAIIDLAHVFGWRVAHFRPAQTTKGWRTAVAADGKGFPDLVLVRDRVVFAELKRKGEKPTKEQADWLDELEDAGAEVYLWRVDDMPEIERVLAPG